MSLTHYQQRTLVLAAVMQTAELAEELAQHGQCNEALLNRFIESILVFDNPSIESLYGSAMNLTMGLEKIKKILFERQQKSGSFLINYFLGILQLASSLMKKKSLLEKLQTGLRRIKEQANYFNSASHSIVIENLASLYQDEIGKLSYRIIIHGNPHYLKQQDVVSKIRALLFAGIRAAVFWRQLGGSRWQLLFNSKKIGKTAETLLKTLDEENPV